MGKAMMGTGEATAKIAQIRAGRGSNGRDPLLEDTSMAGGAGGLMDLTGGDDIKTLNRIREEVDDEANIIFGSAKCSAVVSRTFNSSSTTVRLAS